MDEIDKTNLIDQTKIRLDKITKMKTTSIKRLIKGIHAVKN